MHLKLTIGWKLESLLCFPVGTVTLGFGFFPELRPDYIFSWHFGSPTGSVRRVPQCHHSSFCAPDPLPAFLQPELLSSLMSGPSPVPDSLDGPSHRGGGAMRWQEAQFHRRLHCVCCRVRFLGSTTVGGGG